MAGAGETDDMTLKLGDAFSTASSRVVLRDISQRPDLTPTAKRLFEWLWRAQHQKQALTHLYFSVPTMARGLGVAERTVQRAVRRLVTCGLVAVRDRYRSGSPSRTSNEYRLHWSPYVPAEVHPHQTAALTTTIPEDVVPTVSPDMAFAYPALPPAPLPECQGGEHAETLHTRQLQPHGAGAIGKESDARLISTPAVTGAPLQVFDSPAALRLYLISHLGSRGIPLARFHQWERRYGLQAVARVAIWVLSSPKGAVRSAGAWMDRALRDAWSAPSWVKQAWATRLHRTAIAESQRAAIADQLAQRYAAAQTQAAITDAATRDAAEWAALTSRWDALPSAVSRRARELAVDVLGSVAGRLFTPDHPSVWREWHLRAARELWPEGLCSPENSMEAARQTSEVTGL